MNGTRRTLVSLAALAAGVAASVAVATGAPRTITVTLLGGASAAESSRGTVLTINGSQFSEQGRAVLTVRGKAAPRGDRLATPRADFDAAPQAITLSSEAPSKVVTIGVVDDEADEPTESFVVAVTCGGAADDDCNGSTEELASATAAIEDDDGRLDAVLCSGLMRPVGSLIGALTLRGLFQGCSR